MQIIIKAVATLVAVTALTAALATPAGAEAGTPTRTDIVGVGAETTDYLLDQLSTDYNSQPVLTRKLYSFYPTGTSTITTKPGCPAVTRPNGSNAAIAELKKNLRPSGDATDYCVDFAPSARTTQTGDGVGLDFVRFAQDAVTWSATSTSTAPTHAPTSLSKTELKAIYSCDGSSLPEGRPGPVTWDQVGGTGTNKVVPVIPQSNSGTRADFLGAIYGASPVTLGACVRGTDNTVEENEGTNTIFKGANSQDLVFPYSVAVYLAQTVHNRQPAQRGNQVIGSVENSSTGAVITPTVTSGSTTTLNPQLALVGLTFFVYNVVRDNGAASHVPDYLQPVLGDGQSSGYLCSLAAQADIESYGFRTLSTGCGSITPSIN